MPRDDVWTGPQIIRRAAGSSARRMRRRAGLRPRRPAGWTEGPPDFVGVGVQRAGTKWWYRLICDHPEVHPGAGKERHFFDAFGSRALTDEDVRSYHGLFPRPPGSLTGEWTPRYMHDFWTPALLATAAPEARILVLLRDPWRRYVSGIAHELRVLGRLLRGRQGSYVRAMLANDALARSLYHRQLLRLLDSFDRSQILVLQYERCVENPEGELRRTYRFLGLRDPAQVTPAITTRVGRSSARHELPEHVLDGAARMIADDAHALAELVPEIDLSLWPSCTRAPWSGHSRPEAGVAAREA